MPPTVNTAPVTGDETIEQLRETIERIVDEARTITDACIADERELTDAERAHHEELLLRAEGFSSRLKRKQRSQDRTAGIPAARSGGPYSTPIEDIMQAFDPARGAYTPAGKAARGKAWGQAVIRECSEKSGSHSFKGITPSGTVLTPIPAPIAVQFGQPVSMVRSLIPTETDPAFSFLRQDTRNLRAAPTPPGTKKPESDLLFTRVDDKVSMIAHLISKINRADLMHSDILQRLISSELLFGLEQEIESQILTGSGVGEDLQGLMNTPGIQTAARAGEDGYSLIRVLRSAVTKLEMLGISVEGAGFVLSAPDWEEVETSVLGDGSLAFGAGGSQALPVDRSARTVWGIPVVSSAQCPPGTAFLADFLGSVRLWIPGPARIDWSETLWDPALNAGSGGDYFSHNLVGFRGEIQAGLGVTRPTGVVKINLTPVPTP